MREHPEVVEKDDEPAQRIWLGRHQALSSRRTHRLDGNLLYVESGCKAKLYPLP